MNLQDILAKWEVDAKIKSSELGVASLDIPVLHHRYISILSTERLTLRKLRLDYGQLTKDKTEYYLGIMSEEDLKARKWETYQLTIIRSDLQQYIQADNDVVQLSTKIALQEEKVDTLIEILRNVNARNWQIKNAIDWLNFTNGVK